MRKLTPAEREDLIGWAIAHLVVGILAFGSLAIIQTARESSLDQEQPLPCRGSFGQRLPDKACE